MKDTAIALIVLAAVAAAVWILDQQVMRGIAHMTLWRG
jgi:hypothetical protein